MKKNYRYQREHAMRFCIRNQMQLNIDSGKPDEGSVGSSQIMSLDLVRRRFLNFDSNKEVTIVLFNSTNLLA